MFSRDPELHPFDENHDVSWDHSQSYCSVSRWLAVCLHFTYFLLHPYAPLFSSFPLSPPSQAAPENMLIRAQVKSSSRVNFHDEIRERPLSHLHSTRSLCPSKHLCLLLLFIYPPTLKIFASMVKLSLRCPTPPISVNLLPSPPFSTEFSPGPAMMTASSHLGENIRFCKHFIVHITFIVSKTLFGNVFNHCRSVTLGPSSSWLLSSFHFTIVALIIGFRYITHRK